MATIGTASIILTAEHDKVTRGIKGAEDSLQGFGKRVQTITGSMNDGFTSSLARLGGLGAAVAAVGGAFKVAFSEASRLDNIADATGLATSQIVQFEKAAIAAGVGTEGLSAAVQKMNIVVGQAMSGNETAVKSFAKIGITVDELMKLSPAERFQKIAGAVGSISDRSQQAAVSMEMFGKSSAKLVDMLGREELKAPMDAFDASRIERSTKALEGFSNAMASAWQSSKTFLMTNIGVALDTYGKFFEDKAKIFQEDYDREVAARLAHHARMEKIEKDAAERELQIQRDKIKLYYDSTAKMIGIRNDENEEIKKATSNLGAEQYELNKEYELKKRELTLGAQEKGTLDSKEYHEALLAIEENYLRKTKEITASRLDAERQRGLALERMAKSASDAQASHATESLRGAMGALGDWETKFKKAGDEVKKNREQTKKQLGGDALVLRPKEQIEAQKKADQEAEEATRRKVEMGRAYADSLGNIISLTDEMGKKSKEAFFIDKAAKMAQALINSWVGYTAALTIPPPAGPILAGTTLAAGFYAAGQIATQQPGRADGGPITGGRTYEVGERGPELLQINGRNFIIPGRDGFVNAGSPAAAAPSPTTVNVVVNTKPGQSAVVTQSGPASSPNITIDIIDQMVAAAVSNGRSNTSRAMQARFGLNGARGAQ